MKWIAFVVMTIICWGAYVPMIHHGRLGFSGKSSSLWAFLFVGVAYFLVAVLVPISLLIMRGDFGGMQQSGHGVGLSLVAGIVGSLGALGVILALLYGGSPVAVAPIVFAGAPIVNTIISLLWDKPKSMPNPWFYVGIVLAAGGAALVLYNKPS